MKPHQRRNAKRAAIVSAALLAAAAGQAQAGGLMLYEVGTADVGLAAAGYAARAQDASTVFSNPAGMTRLEGTQLTLGAQALYGDLKFSPGSGTNTSGGDGGTLVGWFPGGGVFYTYSISRNLKVGFAATGNFGLAEKYDADWVGRYYVQETTLLGVSLLPSIAYKVNDNLSLGASLNAMYGVLKYQVAVNTLSASPDGQLKLDDNKWGYGINLGMLYEVNPRTRFGLTYNSEVKLDFSAPAEFSGLRGGVVENALRNRGLLNAKIDLGVKVPQGVMGSVYHEIDDRWAVLGNVGWQQWSKFGKADVGINDVNNPKSLTTDLNYKDTWHVALGGQYRYSAPWTVNFGVAYDSEYQDSSNVAPALTTNDAWRFGLGLQNEARKDFSWGVAAEYLYAGTTDLNKRAALPSALGGRGNLVGSYNNQGIYFMSANFNWHY